MMSKHVLIRCILVGMSSLLLVSTSAFGWGGPSHSAMCHQVFDDAVVAPLLDAIDDVDEIEDYTGEPGSWQDGQWDNVEARAYIPGISSPNGKNWDSLDETTRLKYMMHNCGDVAVPIGHSPACYNPGGYSHTINEAALEAQVSLWDTYPDIEGTSSWYNDETNTTYSYTGTITDILDEHYDACRNNMTWFKSTKHWWGHYPSDNHDAGWNGTAIAQLLMRAMIVDYILAKENIYVAGDALPTGSAGGTILFDRAGSYDPDCIEWDSDGEYSQIYGVHDQGIQYYLYDFNGDVPSGGAWDYISYNDELEYSVNDLIGFGIPTNQWSWFYVAAVDNEGTAWSAGDWMYLSSGGAPEPASLSLLAVGGLALLRRRKRQ
ncbi:MAG: PEP-CTERM sorting domain-containing protein [Phycisphaerae bacterium]|nr:PEP-CTERM sorting domain-containing protein [Phycisphaerae bacterium]